jgi:hypothetical protein
LQDTDAEDALVWTDAQWTELKKQDPGRIECVRKDLQDLVELYRAALARAEAEGFLPAEAQPRLQAAFEAVVAELRNYRARLRQVADAKQEQELHGLKQASRFVSPRALEQIRFRRDRPEAAPAGVPALFHGLAPGARQQDWPAKEASGLGRIAVGPGPARRPGSRSQAAGGGPSAIPGLFLFGVKHGVKPSPIPGAAPVADVRRKPRPDGGA